MSLLAAFIWPKTHQFQVGQQQDLYAECKSVCAFLNLFRIYYTHLYLIVYVEVYKIHTTKF